MPSLKPTAGLEPTPPIPTSDGPTDSADSPRPENQLPATIPDDEASITSAKFSNDQEGAVKALRWNGISERRARRILTAAGGSKFLKQHIMGSVVLNFELPSASIAEKMLKHCAKLSLSKDTSVADKIKLMRAFPGLKQELTKTIHASIVAAEKFNPAPVPQQPTQRPVQIGINVNNNSGFPPLAPMPDRAKRGALEAASTEGDRDRPL